MPPNHPHIIDELPVPAWAALAATVALAVLIAAAACSVLVAVVASWRTRETKR